MKAIKLNIFTCLILMAGSVVAIADVQSSNDWKYEITPYLWAVGFDGTVGNGGTTSPVDSDFQFFSLENLDAYGAFTFDAKKKNWGYYFDVLYVKYSDSRNGPLLTTNITTRDGFLESMITYRLDDQYNVDLLVGARYVDVNLELRLDPGPVIKASKDWLDPLIGMRATFKLSDKWSVHVKGDVGGFGIASDLTANAAVEAIYKIGENTSIKAGYRYLKVDFNEDLFVHDVTLSGVGVGLGYSF